MKMLSRINIVHKENVVDIHPRSNEWNCKRVRTSVKLLRSLLDNNRSEKY